MDQLAFALEILYKKYLHGFEEDLKVPRPRSQVTDEALRGKLRLATVKFSLEWFGEWDRMVAQLSELNLNAWVSALRCNSI